MKLYLKNSENDDEVEEIPSMPGISRFGVNRVLEHLDPLVKKGLKSILLFGVIKNLPKVRYFLKKFTKRNSEKSIFVLTRSE